MAFVVDKDKTVVGTTEEAVGLVEDGGRGESFTSVRLRVTDEEWRQRLLVGNYVVELRES